jgi:hypothetical protein
MGDCWKLGGGILEAGCATVGSWVGGFWKLDVRMLEAGCASLQQEHISDPTCFAFGLGSCCEPHDRNLPQINIPTSDHLNAGIARQ